MMDIPIIGAYSIHALSTIRGSWPGMKHCQNVRSLVLVKTGIKDVE